jgi:hypothetical protein
LDNAKVYKIKIRENILRQVVLTDRNIFIAVVVVITFCVWKMLENFPNDLKVFISIAVCGLALMLFSLKIDRQSIVKVFPRIFSFWQRNKKTRF